MPAALSFNRADEKRPSASLPPRPAPCGVRGVRLGRGLVGASHLGIFDRPYGRSDRSQNTCEGTGYVGGRVDTKKTKNKEIEGEEEEEALTRTHTPCKERFVYNPVAALMHFHVLAYASAR